MQISTTARHCELDAPVREFAQQRLAKLERFARDIQEAHLVVTAEKFRFTAEITLRLKHHEMVSREESDTSKVAVDQAAYRLEQQLRRLKDRRTEHKGTVRGLPGTVGASGEPEPGFDQESGFEQEPDLRSGTED
jgi:putative sigma-54 modulation protein